MTASIGVLHVVESLRLGGAERMGVELTNSLRSVGFRTALLATRGSGPLRSEVRPDVPLLALDRTRRWDIECFRKFRAFVRENEVQVVQSHGPGPLQYVTAALLPGGLRCRHIHHVHNARSEAKDPPPDLRTRLALRLGARAAIGVSRGTCEWLQARGHFPAERTFLLRNGVEVSRFRSADPADLRRELRLGANTILVAMVANYRWEKDHLTALRALAACPSRQRLRLLLVGSPVAGEEAYARSVQETIAELGLEGLVLQLGARSDVPAVLAGADAALLTSRRESGPLALLEYMAAGIPFAATRVGEIGREVPEGEGGFFAAPGDVAVLAHGLETLARMAPDARRRLGERGKLLVAREYDQSGTAARLADIYEQVLRWRD